MKILVLFFAIMPLSWVFAADDCTYDESAQIELLQAIQKTHPDGVLNKETKTLSWSSPSASASTIKYGGCYHLGFTVIKNLPDVKTISDSDVFSLASGLAVEYWNPIEAEILTEAISKNELSREMLQGNVRFNIATEYYSTFYIMHDIEKGNVSITWARTF